MMAWLTTPSLRKQMRQSPQSQRMSATQIIILGLALIGAFLGVLDTSIVYTGTVKMAAQLHLNAGALSWVQVAYALTYAGLMLVGGKLGDIYGRKPLFIASLAIFGVGSLAVGQLPMRLS